MKKNLAYIGLVLLILTWTSCESSDNEFPDFDYQTVYFANQYGLRTIELGESEFVDNTLDNQHKMVIKAAWGGGYTNRNNVVINFKVDESCVTIFILKIQISLLSLCRLLITRWLPIELRFLKGK